MQLIKKEKQNAKYKKTKTTTKKAFSTIFSKYFFLLTRLAYLRGKGEKGGEKAIKKL